MKYAPRSLVLGGVLLVLVFSFWTARSSSGSFRFGERQTDYYNLLIDGWLDGQLSMKVDVPAALQELPDPYDPRLRPPGLALHDASFYRGKYYLYFGVAPVVTLMLPFRLLTGTALPLSCAVLVFVVIGFAASLRVWLRVRQIHFPQSHPLVGLLGVLTLGFSSLGPVLLRRPHMWELAIAAAYAFTMLALLAVFECLHDAPRRRRWFTLAGVCLGLAVASRPTCLVAIPILFVPMLFWRRREGRLPWRVLTGAGVALAVIGGLVAVHNALRFGSPLEFGQRYQLSLEYESKVRHFSLEYLGFNAWRYLWGAANWAEYFPFISPAAPPPRPNGYGDLDDVYGVLRYLPVLWLALAVPLVVRRDRGPDGSRLRAWTQAVTLLCAGSMLFIVLYFCSHSRYQFDFTPSLALLACTGLLGLEQAARRWRRGGRAAMLGAVAGVAGFSAAFGVLYSLQRDRFLQEKNLPAWQSAARVGNWLPAVWQRLLGLGPSAWELDLRPGDLPLGAAETVLSVGDGPDALRVFVRRLTSERIVIGLSREPMPEFTSEPIEVVPATSHRLRIVLGAMLPPETHPWLSQASDAEARLVSRLVRLEWEGKVVVQGFRRFDLVGQRVRVGSASLGSAFLPRFGGNLVSARPVPLAFADLASAVAEAAALPVTGTFALRLRIPAPHPGVIEPLVVTGRSGRGDIVGLESLADDRVRLSFDHWGSATLRSESLEVNSRVPADLVVHLTWLEDRAAPKEEIRGEVRVELNGVSVWRQAAVGFRAEPEEISLAANHIGGSGVRTRFSGEVQATSRLPRR